MNDVQLLAHLLGMAGTDLNSARELSHALLDSYGDLGRVLAQSQQELLRYPDLSENAAVFLLFLPALMHRYSSTPARSAILPEDEDALAQMLYPHFQDQEVERVCAFFLDGHFRLLSSCMVAQGGRRAVSCSVHRVLELALNHRARGVILAHNHPDGSTDFSRNDLVSTNILAQELALVDIFLLDHYLLADGRAISLRRCAAERSVHGVYLPLPQDWFPPKE